MTGSGPGPGRAHRLPLHVRAMRRLPARGRLDPVCEVALEQRIAVPAGDGVPLLTDHYIPLTDDPCPTLLVRTPYGRGFPWDSVYGAPFAAQGFHVLLQSCRGTGGSGGTLDPWRHEVADGQATVNWLREQEWFSGALGVIGTSYLGYTAWALAASAPPELRALFADAAVAPYPFFYGSGAFALQNVLVASVGMMFWPRGPAAMAVALMRLRRNQRRVATSLPLIEAYPAALGGRSELFEEWLTDPDPASPYWSSRDLTSASANLAVPASLVTGWDDVMLDQTLEHYSRIKAAGGEARLIVGPWTHTSIFDKGYPEAFPRALEEFRARLSSPPGRPAVPPVRVHVGGCGQWRDLPEWPPPQARGRHWYLGPDGALGDLPPAQAGSSSFRYDPSDPTPSAGGPVLSGAAGSVDNTRLEARGDVVTFTTAPLTEAVEILGPVSARLRIRASNPHHDVFARLCDVDPRGTSRNVCDGLIRHDPGDRPAGETTVIVPMSSTAYRFGARHRIRLQVSGGAHPRYARNTGTAEPQATATRLAPADIQILHSPEGPCTLTLPVAGTALSPAKLAARETSDARRFHKPTA